MLTLLRDLRRLRRDTHLPTPDRGRSLALRHVDAGSCNGCEHELALTTSPYIDLERYGIGVVASPRHADVLLVTGPVTTRMLEPLLVAYRAMPQPRRIAALGDCALGCNLLGTADTLAGPLDRVLPVDLRIRGCPPRPDQIAHALLALIDTRKEKPVTHHHDPADAETLVDLPAGVAGDFEIYVNGISQRDGTDYHLEGRTVVFHRPLTPEVKMTKFQWALATLGIAGTYKHHDNIDIAYQHGGRNVVATGLRPRTRAEPRD